jgi:outer membrane protein OmpA-like peptidoglycan-associated protein
MIKFLCFAVLAITLSSGCSSSAKGSSAAAGKAADGKVNVNDTTQNRFTLDDATVKINPNNTINEEFGNGLLPNEFVNGEKVNHNFQPTYFAYDSAAIHPQETTQLKMLAGYMESNANFFLIIEGHCDERGSAEYNRALSERRALSVKDFIEKLAPSVSGRINTIGFGEEKLADAGSTDTAHAKNRRAVFVIISKR